MRSQRNQPGSSAPTGLWVYNPWLDLIVGCGAWSAPLLLLAYFSATSTALGWSIAFYALALFFNYPHYMATIYRAYHREDDFRRYRIFTVHITLLLLCAVVITHFWYRALSWISTLYLTGSPWHYSGQNYGLFMMFARRAGAQPRKSERNALYAAFLLSYGILLLNFHTGPSMDPLFLSLNLPGGFSSTAQIALAIAFVVCSAFGLSRLIGQAGWRGMAPSLTLFATQFVWFLLPTVLALGEGLRVPQSRYSTGVLAVMHSAQYLWITSYYARRETVTEGHSAWRPLAYFSVLVVGGIALFVPGPWLTSHLFHFDFTRSFLIFTALVNIHHFILDGAIWKLREGRVAALLIQSQARMTEAVSQAGSGFVAAWGWLCGPTRPARVLRVSVALALLGWGTVDQVRYYLVLHGDNLKDLKRAAALNSYDTSLQMRIAVGELGAGQPEAAAEAWKQAIAADGLNPAPRNAYLQYLTREQRYREAYEITRAALRSDPHSAQTLLNHGLLAHRLGHNDEALQSWQKAVTLDPMLADAHLYLATELEERSNFAEALPHYGKFLDIVAHQGAANRPPAATVISAALKLADCQVRTGHADTALKTYGMAQQLAAETKETKLESFASVNAAGLQAQAGNTGEALRLYQYALRLDDSLHDMASEAVDLYTYAVFLREAGFPVRLAYAVALRAEATVQSDPKQASACTALRRELEKEVGAEAARIRQNPTPVLAEALAVKR